MVMEKITAAGSALATSGMSLGAGLVPMTAKPLPQEVTDALDTIKFWTGIVAAALAVVALMLLGVGMFFAQRRGDGGEALRGMGWWIFGVVLIAVASGLTAVFLPGAPAA